jgi:tRNA-modifying protein YgfZ
MPTNWRALTLDRLGVLCLSGADVVRFLQGQLSNDLALLSSERSLLAGFHNPQGRVIAILRLVQGKPDEVLALMPRELVSGVLERLRRFVLRAKVRLSDATPQWRVSGLIAGVEPAPRGLVLPQELGTQMSAGTQLQVCVSQAPARWIVLGPAASEPPAQCVSAQAVEWTRLDVAAGTPQVYAATSEQFVAQMLNLDLLQAISFSKGCYTGQEVIARAHYRGRVKRRMQRFCTGAPLVLAPGDEARLADGRSVRVVEAAALPDGRCDFLAVAPFGEAAEAMSAADGAQVIHAEPMPLPYALPR